jgi:hypothetical protein
MLAPAVHTFEHEPQWFGSLVVSTQVVPQGVGVTLPQVDAHPSVPNASRVHSGSAPAQVRLQLPQCSAVVTSVSQPSALVQSARPVRQAPTRLQAPSVHATRVGSTPGRRVQSCPQLPQLRTSVASCAVEQTARSGDGCSERGSPTMNVQPATTSGARNLNREIRRSGGSENDLFSCRFEWVLLGRTVESRQENPLLSGFPPDLLISL